MTDAQTSRKLNLGSGQFPKDGFVNVDYHALSASDVSHDLNQIPYPFDGNFFELIEADHVMEHLHDPFQVMGELYRLAAPGALIHIRVPHFSRGFTHADHKRGFDVTFPYYFNPKFPPGYQGIPLELVKMRLTWFAQPYMKRSVMPATLVFIGQALGIVIDFLANLSPWLCSRLWCYWVGGFEEIEFIFRVKK
ncbi:MAG: class I SAM-dependent methyltransferase [Chloroflexota bacterium]